MQNITEKKVIKSDCALCVNCCGLQYHIENGKLVKVEGMPEHPANWGVICPKAENLPEIIYSPERIVQPMKKGNGRWGKISWDEAFDCITDKLKKIIDKYGAHSLAIITGSVAVERAEVAAFAQRFKGAVGTPNLFSVESGCFVSRLFARVVTFGGYQECYDVKSSQCVIVWGFNPHHSRFTLGGDLDEAAEKGMKIIVIDPRKTALAHKGMHISIRPGTDCALALGMMHVIIAEDLYDKEFVGKWTTGFEKLKDHVKEYTPETVEEITSVSAADIKDISRLFAGCKPAMIHQGFGSLDRQTNSFQNSRALAILQAITGNIDVPGGWAMVTLLSTMLADLRIPVEERPIGVEKYPLFYSRPGGVYAPYGAITYFADAVINEDPYPIKALIVCAGNPANTHVDPAKFRGTVGKLDLMVTLDLFMTETAEMGDYFLPAASFVETGGLGAIPVCGVHGFNYVMKRNKAIEPVGESMPDWKIWSELGRRMGFEKEFPWKTDEEMLRHFYEPLKEAKGVSYELLEANPQGIFLPKPMKLYETDGFATPSKKIEIYSSIMEKMGYDPIPKYIEPAKSPISTPELAKEYPLILITGARILEYCHSTMRHVPELRKLVPEPIAEIDPGTAAKHEIANGDMIMIETPVGGVRCKAKVTEDIHPAVVSISHGWTGTSNVNRLISDEDRDPIAGYPQDKAVLCRIRKI